MVQSNFIVYQENIKCNLQHHQDLNSLHHDILLTSSKQNEQSQRENRVINNDCQWYITDLIKSQMNRVSVETVHWIKACGIWAEKKNFFVFELL